jgi:methylthioribose-1-phosphate isomerase
MLETINSVQVSTVPQPVEWLEEGAVRLVDQTRLPGRIDYVDCRSVEELAEAIRSLKVRGAPAIGLAAAYGLCLAAYISQAREPEMLLADLREAASTLRATRPTAVNLVKALDRVLNAARSSGDSKQTIRGAVLNSARSIEEENYRATVKIGEYGAQLLHDGAHVLTHCNTGPLAAGGIGTALGVIYTAHQQGKRVHVWVDETRPVLQGARLTTWELTQWGVPCTLIADNMAASLMQAGKVDCVLVGADRIVANGDVANKIGTYGLAVLAKAHDIPFYVVAPSSTLDPSIPSGRDVVIEQRHPDEITHHGGKRLAAESVRVYNPAFDVTPSGLISCIITESGIMRPPYDLSVGRKKRV